MILLIGGTESTKFMDTGFRLVGARSCWEARVV